MFFIERPSSPLAEKFVLFRSNEIIYTYWTFEMFSQDSTFDKNDDPSSNLMRLMLFAHEWVLTSCCNLMSGLGYTMLSKDDFLFITALGSGGKSVFEVAEILQTPVHEAHRSTRGLELNGFVEITQPISPTVQKQIVFTEKGRHLVDDLTHTLSKIEMVLNDRINPLGVQQMRDVMTSNWGTALSKSDLEKYGPLFEQDVNKLDF